MNLIERLKEEHEWIEQELQELETIMSQEIINYSNLAHVLKKLNYLLDHHILKEQKLFALLEQREIKTSLLNLMEEKLVIKNSHENLMKALLSRSDFKVRSALEKSGRNFISVLRKHIEDQEWLFCSIPPPEVENALILRSIQTTAAV